MYYSVIIDCINAIMKWSFSWHPQQFSQIFEYSGYHFSIDKALLMLVNQHLEILTDDKGAATIALLAKIYHIWDVSIETSTIFSSTSKTIKNMTGQSWNKSKSILLYKSWTFKYDFIYFWYPLRYKVIQYLIGKLSKMVKIT